MKMKRFLIAALALALLIALAPSLPLHTASAATVVTGVAITGIDAPVAGAKPDYTASVSGTGYYVANDNDGGYHNGVLWHDETTGDNLSPDDTFVGGHTYRVIVCVEPKSGYTFSDGTTGTINGKNASDKKIYSFGTATFDYIFPVEKTRISSVAITDVAAPMAGAKPVFSASVSGTGYKIQNYNSTNYHNGVLWRDTSAGNKVLTADDTFIAGHKYEVIVCVEPKSGYALTDATTATINGNAMTSKSTYTDGTATYNYIFPAVQADGRKTVPAVDITIKKPLPKQAPSYSATVTGEGVALNDYTFIDDVTKWEHGVSWYDTLDNFTLGRAHMDDRFRQTYYYEVRVMVKAAEGYRFTTDTKVTVNGQEGEISISGDNATCSFNAFGMCIPDPISDIKITVTEPVAGEKPSYNVAVTGEHGTVAEYNKDGFVHGVKWTDHTTNKVMTASDVFEAGHKYMVTFMIMIYDGYYCDKMHGYIEINGKESYFGSSYSFNRIFECKASPHLFPVDYYGFAEYEGGLFIVYQGDVVTSLNGLVQDPNHPETWYFCSNGQAQLQYTGLAEYGGEWFYVDKGVCDVNRVGAVEYNGGTFIVAAGRWIQEYTGLIQDPNTGIWYFVVGGQVQTGYTGLAQYDGAWFYLINGVLAVDYTGPVVYDGSTFNVVNGQVA